MTPTQDFELVIAAHVLGRAITVGQLRECFDRVAPAGNWKERIDRVVDVADDFEQALLREAVIHFTGSVPKFSPVAGGTLPGCRYRVTAAGYYRTVGA